MVANRIMGSFWLLVGMALMGVAGFIAGVGRLAGASGILDLITRLPAPIPELVNFPGIGPVPPFFDIFLVILGTALLFYGGAMLRRVSWALLIGSILSGVLAIFLVALLVGVVYWRWSKDPYMPALLYDNAYYLAFLLGVLALLDVYGMRRMHSLENRNAYAGPFAKLQAPIATCEKCGRILTDGKCPVHDLDPINGLLVNADGTQQLPVRAPVVRIGRDKSNTIVLEQRDVARQQAAIVHKDSNFYLVNISRSNPTLLNGRPLDIPLGQDESPPQALKEGNEVVFGSLRFTFYADAHNYTPVAPAAAAEA